MTFPLDPHPISPVDVIALRLTTGDDTALELWRYCANQWLENGIVDAVDYFIDSGSNPTEQEPLVDPELEEDEEDRVEAELPQDDELPDDIKELIAINRDYLTALDAFWLDMLVFTTDVDIPNWEQICNVARMLARQNPVDIELLITNVRRLNKARIEVEALIPRRPVYAEGSELFSFINTPGA